MNIGMLDLGSSRDRPVFVKRKPDHVLFVRLRVWLWSLFRKLLAGTKHRLSGLSHPRQCGDDVFRMFVTGAPPYWGGPGIPQRAIASSRPPSAPLRTIGAI